MDPTIPQMFEHMPAQYNAGVLSAPRTYYFSLGSHKFTAKMTPDACVIEQGKTVDSCDCVLKTTEKIFTALVLHGKRPGTLDVARGRFKTNDLALLSELGNLFTFKI